jgi:hypothetical protein
LEGVVVRRVDEVGLELGQEKALKDFGNVIKVGNWPVI